MNNPNSIELNSPVLFIIFNRIDYVKKVFDSIKKVKPQNLYIASDGARTYIDNEDITVKYVRDYVISNIDWKCKVTKLFKENNLSPKKFISSAITWFFENEEYGIIIEEDCLPHEHFFRFCEELLIKYKDDERIMMISGQNNEINSEKRIKESYFFYKYTDIWGWASWRRAWKYYDLNMKNWEKLRGKELYRTVCDIKGFQKYVKYVFDQLIEDNIETWDTQWSYACLANNGLCIIPVHNLVSNIGVFGVNTYRKTKGHCMPTIPINFPIIHPNFIFPDPVYNDFMYKHKLKKIKNRRFFAKILKFLGLYWFLRKFYKKIINLLAKNK